MQRSFKRRSITMKRLYRAVVEGNIIRLSEKIDLPDGTETLVTLAPVKRSSDRDITKRQVEFLEKGFEMGSVLYSKREELYEK
jgi:hypothetical protein